MTTAEWAKLGVDIIIILHFAFVLFVLFGALLLLKWRKLIWLHIPAVAWGMLVELNGWLCPLTPLENHLRALAGLGMYHGDFVMHYIMPVLYPVNLTRTMQVVFGLIVMLVNVAVYLYVFRIKPRRHP
jgi:uncharacterized protein with PQ loop repeat